MAQTAEGNVRVFRPLQFSFYRALKSIAFLKKTSTSIPIEMLG